MSETPQDSNPVLQDWLSSTVIFRTFRMAVQPGSLVVVIVGHATAGQCHIEIQTASDESRARTGRENG